MELLSPLADSVVCDGLELFDMGEVRSSTRFVMPDEVLASDRVVLTLAELVSALGALPGLAFMAKGSVVMGFAAEDVFRTSAVLAEDKEDDVVDERELEPPAVCEPSGTADVTVVEGKNVGVVKSVALIVVVGVVVGVVVSVVVGVVVDVVVVTVDGRAAVVDVVNNFVVIKEADENMAHKCTINEQCVIDIYFFIYMYM